MMTREMVLALALAPLAGAWAQQGDEPQEPGSGTAECMKLARAETPLSEYEASLLCQGARSTEPVTCFVELSEYTFLDRHQILRLCSPTLSGRIWNPDY